MALLIATTRGLWRIAPWGWLTRKRRELKEQSIAALAPTPGGGIVCITDSGDLLRLMRGGCSWQPVPAHIEGAERLPTPTALACDAAGAVWCGVSPIDLWRGTPAADGEGIAWERCDALRTHPAAMDWWGLEHEGTPRVTAIVAVPSDAGHALVAVAVGGVWQTTNHGQTWATRHEGITPLLAPDARFTSAHRAVLDLTCHPAVRVLLARTDTALYYADMTSSEWRWRDITPPAPERMMYWPASAAVAPGDPATVWVLMIGHDDDQILTLWRTVDAGATWQTVTSCPPGLSPDAGAIVLADPHRSKRIAVISEETLWLWRGKRWRRMARGLGHVTAALWL